MDANLVKVKCGICGQDDPVFLFEKDGTRYVRCKSCDFIYVNPRKSMEAIIKTYDKWGKEIYTKDEYVSHIERTNYDVIMKRIEEYIPSGNILDVGCSIGGLLVSAKNRNWGAYGVELSQIAGHYARARFGLNIHIGDIFNSPFSENYFDIICYNNTLEHVFSPKEELSKVYRLLKKDGFLFVSVPNWNCLERCILGKKWRVIADMHFSYFTISTLNRLLTETGFSPIKWSTTYFDFINIYEGLFKKQTSSSVEKVKKIDSIEDNIKKRTYYPFAKFVYRMTTLPIYKLKLGSVMEVFAKKAR